MPAWYSIFSATSSTSMVDLLTLVGTFITVAILAKDHWDKKPRLIVTVANTTEGSISPLIDFHIANKGGTIMYPFVFGYFLKDETDITEQIYRHDETPVGLSPEDAIVDKLTLNHPIIDVDFFVVIDKAGNLWKATSASQRKVVTKLRRIKGPLPKTLLLPKQ